LGCATHKDRTHNRGAYSRAPLIINTSGLICMAHHRCATKPQNGAPQIGFLLVVSAATPKIAKPYQGPNSRHEPEEADEKRLEATKYQRTIHTKRVDSHLRRHLWLPPWEHCCKEKNNHIEQGLAQKIQLKTLDADLIRRYAHPSCSHLHRRLHRQSTTRKRRARRDLEFRQVATM
jgi:hypothetical protein